MEETPTQSPTIVEASDTASTKLHPGATETKQDQPEDNNRKHGMERQVNDQIPAGDPATCETGEEAHLDQNVGKHSPGKEIPGQNSVGHAQDLTGETTYHWLKDISTRVKSIEERLIEEDDESSDEDSTVSPDDDDSHMFVTRPEVRDCHWETFKNRFPTEDNTVPAIETLLRSAELVAEVQEEQLKRKSQGSSSPPNYQKPFKPSSKSPSSAPDDTYERIRINSALILAFLSKVAEDGSLANPPLKPLTFLRPFKVLVHFYEQMEKEFLWLEKKFGNSTETDQALALESETSPDIFIPEVRVAEDQSVNRATVQESVPERVQDAPVDLYVDPSKQKERDNTPSPTRPNPNKGEAKSRHDLSKIVENGSYEAYRQMKCYVNFVRTKLIPRYKRFDLADHRNPPRVRYGDLWSLFRVGELVLRQDAVYQRDTSKSDDSQLDSDHPRSDTEEPKLWRVIRIGNPLPTWVVDDLSLTKGGQMWDVSKGTEHYVDILLYYVDFDGKSYRSIPIEIRIPFFANEKAIISLPIYPVRFAKDHERILKQLQKRGETFQRVVSQSNPVQSYEGWTLIRDPSGSAIEDASGNYLKFPEHIDGDVIIDFHEALQIHPWWRPRFSKWTKEPVTHAFGKDCFPINSWADKERSKLLGRTWEWTYVESDGVAALEYNQFVATNKYIFDIDHEATDSSLNSATLELSPEDLALLPSRIFVYALRERKFVNADIQYLEQSSVESNPFGKLEIAEEHKDLIMSTVWEHFERKKVRRDAQRQGLEMRDQDFIHGKGRGLIILLHGAPGVGKTATAEACSYAYNKPLFPITCGDLGIEPQIVEETLSELFRLANLWDCILLFDEADIFLSTREKKDDNLQRNALVSIFLRTLEYYSGVLFLTTNRAGVLDEAVKSRVHISLYYPYLGLKETKALFQTNIDRLRNIEAERARITGKPPMAIEEKRILEFAEKHYEKFEKDYDKRWNGRQIRNAFQVATSLARHQYHRHCEEGNPHRGLYMTSDHFMTVQEATNEYDDYRQKLFNKTDVDIAKEREERYHPS